MTRKRPLIPFLCLTLALLAAGAPATARADDDGADDRSPRRDRIVRVVEKARRAVVSIKTPRTVSRDWFPFLTPFRGQPLPEGALGSGVIFHPDGFVITNAHVIASAGDILVDVPAGDGPADEFAAHPIAVDLPNDLAILRLVPEEGAGQRTFAHLSLGRSNDLMLGETVIAVGHPLRLGLTVTRGIISGLKRKLLMRGSDGSKAYEFDDFIQVDAPVNLGNSGGPLFDVTGRWIGVNSAIYARGGMSTAEGIGFAIPIDRVRSLVAKAFKRRLVTGNWYGIELEEGDDGVAVVRAVYPRGPAADSEIRPGDVVTDIDGVKTPSLYEVRMHLISLPTGNRARFGLIRAGKAVGPIELAEAPVPTRNLSLQHLGFEADDADVDGVVITRIRPESPAAEIQLLPNDVLLELGPFKISNTDELLRFLQFVKPGDVVDVRVRRLQRVRGGAVARSLKGKLEAQ